MTAITATRFQQLIEKSQTRISSRRKIVNAIMLGLTGLMTIFALVPLFWIVGYVVYKGGQYVNLDFFIHTPRPLGFEGGVWICFVMILQAPADKITSFIL